MRRIGLTLLLCSLPVLAVEPGTLELPADVLKDKIHGAVLGQIFGNLNGLRHEMKYIEEPGNVETYTPSLPGGARTDDDTDIEWIYHYYMEKHGQVLLPPPRIVEIWKAHLNRGIWCSNLYVRNLMDLGIEPHLTGSVALNPWAVFNLWGQFGCESFGLMAPGMPQTGCRIGLHYTRVSIDAEPAQVTQFLDTMFALAYFESDLDKLIDAGAKALDPKSEIVTIVGDVRRWHKEHPADWRATRKLIRDRYTRFNGDMPDKNGVVLNIASIVGALLYANGDFKETVRLCFNFGWDADCTAATAGCLIGQIKGKKWMQAQGWQVKDLYANTTRPGMPNDETITSYGERVSRLAHKVILENGGRLETRGGVATYVVRAQSPKNVLLLTNPAAPEETVLRQLETAIHNDLRAGDDQSRARAAYLAMALGHAPAASRARPAEWSAAVEVLQTKYPNVVKNIYGAPQPRGTLLIERAKVAGLGPPPAEKK